MRRLMCGCVPQPGWLDWVAFSFNLCSVLLLVGDSYSGHSIHHGWSVYLSLSLSLFAAIFSALDIGLSNWSLVFITISL